jgi:hypothetical protein
MIFTLDITSSYYTFLSIVIIIGSFIYALVLSFYFALNSVYSIYNLHVSSWRGHKVRNGILKVGAIRIWANGSRPGLFRDLGLHTGRGMKLNFIKEDGQSNTDPQSTTKRE